MTAVAGPLGSTGQNSGQAPSPSFSDTAVRSTRHSTTECRIDREIEFFDHFGNEHGDYDVLGERAYARLLNLFDELIRPTPDFHVVDLGCGSGAFTRRLARRFGCRATGLDISPGLIQNAVDLAVTEEFRVGNILDTKLETGSVDAIVYSGVLHHLDSRELRVETLIEGLRILKPHGRMFAYDPSWHSPSMWLYRDPASPLHSKQGKTENEVLLQRGALESELIEAGFDDVRIRGVSGITFKYVEGRIARFALPLYNLYELAMQFSPFEDRLGTFLVSTGMKK
jgi:SAM-dependent methyltransferase